MSGNAPIPETSRSALRSAVSRIGFEGTRQDAYRTRFAEKCCKSMSINEQENPCRVWVCGYAPAVDNPLIFPYKEEVGGSSPSTPTEEIAVVVGVCRSGWFSSTSEDGSACTPRAHQNRTKPRQDRRSSTFAKPMTALRDGERFVREHKEASICAGDACGVAGWCWAITRPTPPCLSIGSAGRRRIRRSSRSGRGMYGWMEARSPNQAGGLQVGPDSVRLVLV